MALLVALYKTHDLATLERLYVVDGLSLKQVADDLGPPASKRTVQRALEAGGIRLRPARPPATKELLMSRELLEKLYVDEGRNLDEVAAVVGVNVATVKARMRRLDVKRRKGAWRRVGDREPMTHDLLYELRIVQKLPAVEIGRMLGYSEIQARSALARHGIAFRPRRPGVLVLTERNSRYESPSVAERRVCQRVVLSLGVLEAMRLTAVLPDVNAGQRERGAELVV